MLTGNSTLPIQKQLKSVNIIISYLVKITFNIALSSRHNIKPRTSSEILKIYPTENCLLHHHYHNPITITIVSLNSDIITVWVQNVNFKIPLSGFLKAITKLVVTPQF
jgi:hypothetical protein